ncbi:putative membrane protein [Synechococcus sp. BOUM118]|nr:putative membrane protein [Synechococcus sp. BOUM118]
MLCWLFSQVLALPLLVHHRHRALQAMDHSRQLVRHNGLKVLALLGLLIGINLLGLIGASLGLLFSLPFSALILMACGRTQTPCRSVSRRNMLPT